MSILNKSNSNEPLSAEVRVANKIKRQTLETYKNLLNTYVEGLNSFWKNPSAKPEDIARELGTDAAEIFSLHAKLGDFLSQFNENEVNEAKKVIGNFTINSDGTVSV